MIGHDHSWLAASLDDCRQLSIGTDDSDERAKPKAWKEIWGSGQGVGSVGKVVPTAELIARFRREYDEAVDPAL
jgi:nitronate monooxygenase